MKPELKIGKPQIKLEDAVGQRLVAQLVGFEGEHWLLFEKGFCMLAASRGYDGDVEIDQDFDWAPSDRLQELVSLGVVGFTDAEKFREAVNEQNELDRAARERARYLSLKKRFEP